MDSKATANETTLITVPTKFASLVQQYLQRLEIQEQVGCLQLQTALGTSDPTATCECENVACEIIEGEVYAHPNYENLFPGFSMYQEEETETVDETEAAATELEPPQADAPSPL